MKLKPRKKDKKVWNITAKRIKASKKFSTLDPHACALARYSKMSFEERMKFLAYISTP